LVSDGKHSPGVSVAGSGSQTPVAISHSVSAAVAAKARKINVVEEYKKKQNEGGKTALNLVVVGKILKNY
jgi:hypothetical protein